MSTSSGKITCMLCLKTISHKNNVRRHFKTWHFDDGSLFKCPACPGIDFKETEVAIRKHIDRIHPHLKGIDFESCRVFQ